MWFDDEERQDTTIVPGSQPSGELWFDDEERQDTTSFMRMGIGSSCGLMMKKDKIQQSQASDAEAVSCGLMMKKDKIQQRRHYHGASLRCGLMMKKDKIQRA